MPKSLACLAAACLFATPALAADSPFTGTWKLDTGTAKATIKPDVFVIKDGMYRCPSCTPAVTMPADGAFHKASGHDYWDEMSVTVVDPRHVSYVQRRGGVVVGTDTDELSDDGNTLTSSSSSSDNPTHQMMTSTSTELRTGPAPAGAHPMSGTWRAGSLTAASDNSVTLVMNATPTTLEVKVPTGEHYLATLGGAYVPVEGDPAGTMVKARAVNSNTMELTQMRKGAVTSVMTLTVSPDGGSITGHTVNRKTGSTNDFVANKQ